MLNTLLVGAFLVLLLSMFGVISNVLFTIAFYAFIICMIGKLAIILTGGK